MLTQRHEEAGEVPPGLRIVAGSPRYAVSADGTVWSTARQGGWRRLKPSLNTRGGLKLKIAGHSCSVATLVAVAFLPPRQPSMVIGYRDGNKRNVAVSNLYWMSESAKNRRAYKSSGWATRHHRLYQLGFLEWGYAGSYPRRNAIESPDASDQVLPAKDIDTSARY